MCGGSVRTRFAPSPTGGLHVGGARTALFNWLFARHAGGAFVLRMEDTDPERSEAACEAAIIEDLKWLGLSSDEGPSRQSERGPVYTEHAEKLVKSGAAYRCYCSKERLEELKNKQIKAGRPSRYDGRCRELKEAPEGGEHVIRFRVPEGRVEITFDDSVHGPLSFDTADLGDFIIVGSDGLPSYNFAVVVDDSLMEITHVLRGDDHLSNTPRQILLAEALGFVPPVYAHIPLVTAPDGSPLGKRHGAASVAGLREGGYLPEGITNALARLGWSPGERFLTLEEMAEGFSLEKLSKSPSVFDTERLRRFNREALSRADTGRLVELLATHFKEADSGRVKKAVDAIKAEAFTLTDIPALAAPLVGELRLAEDAKEVLKSPGAVEVVRAFRTEVKKTDGPSGSDKIDEKSYNGIMKKVKETTGERGKKLFMPVRAALTGRTEGLELVTVVEVLGRDEVLRRLHACVEG